MLVLPASNRLVYGADGVVCGLIAQRLQPRLMVQVLAARYVACHRQVYQCALGVAYWNQSPNLILN